MKKKYISQGIIVGPIIVFCSFLFFLYVSLTPSTFGHDLSLRGSGKNGMVKGEIGKKIDQYFNQITPYGFSGALLVAKDGEVILNKGYGMAIRIKHIPNTSETVFSTGSITKQFTAAGIMMLEMQEKLSTGDSISKFFKKVPEEKKGITLHHLLTHTAGVINYTGMDYEKAKRDETVSKILKAPLLFKPGERFEYSNAGYSLLAAIIEKVSGRSYEEYLNEQLFKPAGMEFTGYRIPDWNKKLVAHWYVGDKDNGIPLEKPYPYWNLLGNGGILSTTGDMYKWHLALKGGKILSPEVKKKIFTPFLNDYGYGWDVLKTERGTLIQHDGGSMLGSSAEIRRYIDADVVTILFCNQSFGKGPLFEVVRDKLEILVFGGNVDVPPSVVTLETEKLKKFEGMFGLSSGGQIEIRAEKGGLKIKAEGQDALNMLFFPENPDPGLFNDLNSLSESIFKAALKRDYEPFEDVLHNKEERSEQVRQFIEMRLHRYKERTGEIKKVRATGTLPTDFNGKKAALTYVQLEGEKGSIFFGLYWHNKKNIGVGPLMSIPEFSVPFMLISGTEFAGYQMRIAKNIRIHFNLDERGLVTALIVQNTQGDLSAHKIKT